MRNHALLAVMICILAGCDKETEKVVDLANKQVEQAHQQVQAVMQEAQHVQRLRDIDLTRFNQEKWKAESETTTWRGIVTCSAIILVVLVIWLSHELRQRRIVSHILLAQKNQKEVNSG